MNKFIEIVDGKRRYINIRCIEAIEEMSEKQCVIYMLPHYFSKERAFYKVDKSYDEVIAMVKGGDKNNV